MMMMTTHSVCTLGYLHLGYYNSSVRIVGNRDDWYDPRFVWRCEQDEYKWFEISRNTNNLKFQAHVMYTSFIWCFFPLVLWRIGSGGGGAVSLKDSVLFVCQSLLSHSSELWSQSLSRALSQIQIDCVEIQQHSDQIRIVCAYTKFHTSYSCISVRMCVYRSLCHSVLSRT